MDWLIVGGVVSLGLLVGLLVGWFVNEDQPFTVNGLVACVTVLSGAGVAGIFHLVSPNASTREYWLYPVTLLLGMLAAPRLDIFYNDLYKKHTTKKAKVARRSFRSRKAR
jgi:hypothetical protein